jgi:hypothetical protein
MTGEAQNSTSIDYRLERLINATRDFSANGPRPDCSSITDSELASAIIYRRLRSNVIYYSFESPFTLSNLISYPALFPILRYQFLKGNRESVDVHKKLTRLILVEIERLSAGRVKFVENNAASEKIFINFLRKDAMYHTQRWNNVGETVRLFSQSGRVSSSVIWIADNDDIVSSAHTISHEIFHSLGYAHLHEYPILNEKLNNIPEGRFCSQIAYYSKILTPISACSTNCNISIWDHVQLVRYPLLPGQLDVRLLDLSYSKNIFKPGTETISMNYLLGMLIGIRISGYYMLLSHLIRAMSRSKNLSYFSERYYALAKDLSLVLAFAATTVMEKEMLVGLTLLSLVKFWKHDYIQKNVTPGDIQDLASAAAIDLVIVLLGELHPLLCAPRLISSLFVIALLFIVKIRATESQEKMHHKIEPEVVEGNNIDIEDATEIVVEDFQRRKVISYLFTDKVENDELNIPDENLQNDNFHNQLWLI